MEIHLRSIGVCVFVDSRSTEIDVRCVNFVVGAVAFFLYCTYSCVAVVVVVDGGNSYLMSSSSFIYAIDVLFTRTLIIFISSKFKLVYLIGGVNSTIFHEM